MVKKLKQMADKQAAGAAGVFDSKLAHSVKDSAHQIWLAGMGAFSKAQAEGGKVFEALIKEGTSLQKKTQHVAEEKFNEVSSKMTGMAGEVQSRAGQQWDKLESIFEARTAKALGKLGVPSAKDVESLTRRIDELNEQLAQMGKTAATRKSAARPAAKSATKPAAKTAAKRAARPAVKRSTATKTVEPSP
ncbi:MAG: phasin family protein [Rhizobacter sp.]|nr:phasin family protein [Rhizobacter sp.]